jgi:hypothetical protein
MKHFLFAGAALVALGGMALTEPLHMYKCDVYTARGSGDGVECIDPPTIKKPAIHFSITPSDLPGVLTIDQPKDEPPVVKYDSEFSLIIDVTGAPCMVEEAGKCRIRANHLEVR